MNNKKVMLKSYVVNQIMWNELLNECKADYGPIDEYMFGYIGTDHEKSWNAVVDLDKREMVIPSVYLYDKIKGLTVSCFREYILRLDDSMAVEQKYVDDINGLTAWRKIYSVLNKYYTEEEIEEQYKLHESEFDPQKIQKHDLFNGELNTLYVLHNCRKYDINGAHNDALCEIFPRCAHIFKKMYDERKTKPNNKKYVNYFVGMLARCGHRLTYNWIVQRTTAILNKAIETVGGELVYANTDGFIVKDPTAELPVSKELGQFKQEYEGEVRFYRTSSYFAYEIDTNGDEDRVKGSIRLSVRDKIDLKHRIAPQYVLKRNENGSIDVTNMNIINIQEEIEL